MLHHSDSSIVNSIETFYGAIESTADALRVFELCRQGKLGRVRRRLHDAERRQIRSGSVFVFDEAESGIRRWTDGRLWSPSRIHGNFLVYRELEKRSLSQDDWFSELEAGLEEGTNTIIEHKYPDAEPTSEELGLSESLLDKKNRTLQRSDEQARSSRYIFKRDGLVKRTISAKVDGRWQHLVCYYSRTDFASAITGRSASDTLFAPQLMSELRSVRVPIDLVVQQNFRRPPLLTASAGRNQEIPLIAAPRPRRHSTSNSAGSSDTSATPIPIASDLIIRPVDDKIAVNSMNPDHSIIAECVDATLARNPVLPSADMLLDIGALEPEDLRAKPRWTEPAPHRLQVVSDDEEEWNGCFLRGNDPSLAPVFPENDSGLALAFTEESFGFV